MKRLLAILKLTAFIACEEIRRNMRKQRMDPYAFENEYNDWYWECRYLSFEELMVLLSE